MHNLNRLLKQQLNPRGGDGLSEGDKVIQLTNDYERRVFNGDAGIVTSSTRNGMFTVEFARSATDEPIEYARSALDRDIGLSYALTVRGLGLYMHAARGSDGS